MEGVKGQHFQNQHKGLTFGSLNFSDHLGLDVSSDKNADVLNQEVQNLALKDSIEENGTVQGVLMESEHMEHRRYRYYHPLRPEAENCLFFMRHGWCQFRGNCRYNHPLNRKIQPDYKEIENLNEENLTRTGQVECKYYLTPEGCKYGKACKYNHSGRETEKAPVFLGLPIRPGEKEGPQDKRIGSNSGWENALPFCPSALSSRKASNWENARPFWPSTVSKKASEPVSQQHPHKQAERSKTSVCPVNDKDLPLRPDMEICPYYSRYGICKRGPGCRFDHRLPPANPEPVA
ncbi:zinc finger CCCH domain-containing protein 8-like isoform X1 [Apium graveolens]|uniref:zinc finger CCCH domain-containing protein 8-like isoform X1 n=1 Tax=Apium graveolens TaxID=4045 RepID=UPI003D7941CC